MPKHDLVTTALHAVQLATQQLDISIPDCAEVFILCCCPSETPEVCMKRLVNMRTGISEFVHSVSVCTHIVV